VSTAAEYLPPAQEPTAPVASDRCLFIVHSLLDDLPLTAVEFRLYAHAVRRGGLGGNYWESVPNAARHCGVRPATLRRALKRLLQLELLNLAEKPPGRTWTYMITHPDNWTCQPLPNKDPRPKSRVVSNRKGTPLKRGRGSGSSNRKGTPLEQGYTKVVPLRSPRRHSLKGEPPGNGEVGERREPTTAELISYEGELARIDVALKDMRNKYPHGAWGPEYDDFAKSRIRELKDRREQLKEWLGCVA
jgi:hypothetical protein